jgi:hypothetical protein
MNALVNDIGGTHRRVGFIFKAVLKCRVKLINDPAVRGWGSYHRGTILFLGLRAGLGSVPPVTSVVEPMGLEPDPLWNGEQIRMADGSKTITK